MVPYVLFFLGNDSFHWVDDLIYALLYVIALRVSLKTDQRQHLKWIIPGLISCAVQLVYRSLYNIHFVFRSYWAGQTLMAWDIFLDIGEVFGIYSAIVLFLTLFEYMRTAAAKSRALLEAQGDSTGTWPPAPTRGGEG